MAQLPPEDQPPSLLPASSEDAIAAMGPPGPENPVSVGAAFLAALSTPGGPDLATLQLIVTPESWPAWGDFRAVAEGLADCGMTSQANRSEDDPDVVYVKYVTDHDGVTYQAQEEMVMMLRAVGTMVHRPSLGGWRLHAVGDYVLPEQVPHD